MTNPTSTSVRRLALLTGCALLLASGLLSLTASRASAQPLDIGDWQIVQYNSNQTYTIPAGTTIQPGGYLVLSRYASQSAFETFYGVTLGSNVIYQTNPVDNPVVPMINGDEIYELKDDFSFVVDGPTPAIATIYQAHHRDDPEAAPWTSINSTPTPGSGVEAQDATYSGMVITEVNDPSGGGNYVYEFVELYYDADPGTTNLPPVISNTQHVPASPQDGDDLTVSTTATDTDGTVVEVLCYWRHGGGSYSSVPMSGVGDDYSTTFLSLAGDALFEYYITAEDNEGALSSDPGSAPAAVYSVWVQGDLPSGHVILFDHAHAQDAGGDGNWRIDNNYPDPVPANPTSETDWSGQLSAWAYELFLAAITVRSNTTPIDAALLAGVDMMVIVEPQNQFSGAEIAAIGTWVHGGGNLFVIANHNGSDRNSNGWDSASILGGYTFPHISDPVGSDTETFCGALFGLHFHVKDEGNNSITGTFSNVDTDPANPIINGASGPVNAVIYHVGNVMALWPTANPDLTDVAGHIWKDGDTGNPDVNIAAWSRYGDGRVVGFGDSSSCADGTGSEPHANNWNEAGADNREFFLNATWWLLTGGLVGVADGELPGPSGWGLDLRAWPNPFNPTTAIHFSLPAAGWTEVAVYDLRGSRVRTVLAGQRSAGEHSVTWDGRDDGGRRLPSGVYLVRATGPASTAFTKVSLAK